MNYPDLSKILANPTIPTASAPPQSVPTAPPSYIPETVIHSQQPIGGYPQINTYRTEPPQIHQVEPNRTPEAPTGERSNNTNDYTNLYNSILKQISYSLINRRYIVSEWSNDDSKYETYIWYNKMFLGKISIIFTNEENDLILPHSADISITTRHLSNIHRWGVFETNNKYTYHISVNLNENNVLYLLCKDIYRIITPNYLIPKKKMTFWNLLDGSYFVKNY